MADVLFPLSLAASATALAAGGAYFGSERLRKFLHPDLKETFLSDSLDFDTVHDDGMTLLGRDGSLTRTFLIEGRDYGLCREEELTTLLKRRRLFFDAVVAKEGISLKLISRRIPVEGRYEGTYDNPYLQEIHDCWQAQFKKTYRTLHYLVLTKTPASSTASLFKKRPLPPLEKGKFEDVCERLENVLEAFKAKPLLVSSGQVSPLLSFWASLINGHDTPLGPFKRHLAERLVGTSLEFDWRHGRFYGHDGIRPQVGAILSLQKWGEESSSNLFRELYRLEGDITFLHLVEGVPKLKALATLERRELHAGGLFTGRTDKAALEYETARQVIQDEEGSLHEYQFSLILRAATEEALKDLITQVRQTFLSYGTQGALETQALEHVWRSQFPGPVSFVRKSTLLSHNLAHILTFDKDPVGVQDSDWGKGPLRPFKTINGSSFPLNLHVSEKPKALGHNLVVAPTGSGKTTLIQHIIAGALRHPDLRVYLFDRFNGTRIFTQAGGGDYIDIESHTGVQLNPFVVDDSLGNRARLRRLLRLMAGMEEGRASELNTLVDLLLGLPKELRVFKNLHTSLLESQSPLSAKLQEWATGPYAPWFNGAQEGQAFDALDLTARRLVGFEMTQVLQEEAVVGPLTYYLMERVLAVIREKACPAWLFIDETKPMLEVPYFKRYVAMLLRELRKIGGVVTLCFQAVSDIQESGMASIILGQCETLFLFPNPKAKEDEYKIFNLTDSEWDYIKGNNKTASKFHHTVLVKKPQESVILNIDLACLGPLLNLYSSDNDKVAQVKTLQQRGGDQWVDQYLNRV